MKCFVLNGWAASPHAWDLCPFAREADAIFSYVDQLDGLPERALEAADEVVLVGWSMGGSGALRLACRYPEKVRALVLVAATPRMMEDRATGWRGMTDRRLDALRRGLELTHGEGFFGVPAGRPNPYLLDSGENLDRGLRYLTDVDLRAPLAALRDGGRSSNWPVAIFQAERDGIVRAENAAFLKSVFPQAEVTVVPGSEHALPVLIPELIDATVRRMLKI